MNQNKTYNKDISMAMKHDYKMTISQLEEMYESLKPLNFGRRLAFHKYCEYLVKDGQIEQSCVDKYTSKEFLFEEYNLSNDEQIKSMIGDVEKKISTYIINFTINITTMYVMLKLIKYIFT